jgi:hypothetical protein
MGSPVQDSAKSAKQLAINVAKRAAREPLEILKEATSQSFGDASKKPQEQDSQSEDNKTESSNTPQKETDNKKMDAQRLQALEREIGQIHSEKVYREIMQRVANGEDVPLTDVPELTPEQKQVLMAQMEAVKQRRQVEAQQPDSSLNISAKPSRKFFGIGAKQAAQKQTTRVERPVPPSG